jgi:ElaB/YqjD/DUF883 family membrane-anchored ribosome-binding protein
MALDLTDDAGDLDRGKVNAELDKILADVPDEFDRHYDASTQVASAIRQRLVDLLDEVQHTAYINGQVDAEATERANN